MDKQQAYYHLWSQFRIPAYDENSVPDRAAKPYITYQVLLDDLEGGLFPTASLWYKDSSWEAIDLKLIEISGVLGHMLPIELDDGYMYVTKNTPFAQRMKDDTDETVKRYVMNIGVEFLTQD